MIMFPQKDQNSCFGKLLAGEQRREAVLIKSCPTFFILVPLHYGECKADQAGFFYRMGSVLNILMGVGV